MTDWTRHSTYSDPGRHAAALGAIEPAPGAVAKAVQGLLIHGGALEHYGLRDRAFSRETLKVEERLSELLGENDAPLHVARAPSSRALGTCRDFALMTCAIFRHHRVEARVRCGFASYLGGSPWEDHWICEGRIDGDWVRIDAQLDPVLRRALGTYVEPVDLPATAFLDARETWLNWRAGSVPSGSFGHGDANGPWFMLVNLMRDRLALADQLTSDWDGWRTEADRQPTLSAELLAAGDAVADDAGARVPAPWWTQR